MGKKRPSGAPTTARHPIIDATERVVAALEEYAAVVERHKQRSLAVLALPEDLEHLAAYAACGDAAEDVRDLKAAWRVIDEDLPVAAAGPHSEQRAGESHRRWQGPLQPHELLEFVELAAVGDAGYRPQMAANAAFFAARQASATAHREALCGRPTKGGHACGVPRVYVPPGGFADGPACWRHLSAAETAHVRGVYERAVAVHDCPGCVATAGQRCITQDAAKLRLVDGEWAHVRSFDGLKVHDARLDLAPAAELQEVAR